MRAVPTQVRTRPALIGRYVGYKVAERRRQRRLRRGYDRIVTRVPTGAHLRASPIDLPSARALPHELQDAAELLRREAEAIVAGTVDFLGSGPVSVGREIDWHRDFKSGYRWSPTTFYQDLEITRLSDSSDAKVPWELSRGHQFLTLARAATLFEQDHFADELERQLAHWIAANPPGFGINWTNPMEVAIRAVNWIWAIRTVETFRPIDARLRAEVTASLQAHARHLATNLEGSPLLRSNHYLSDILGLLALGAYIDGDPSARRWLKRARLAFERQILDQVLDDGVGFEASTSYHGLALEIFLIAKHIASEVGQPFSPRYDLRLVQMLEVSRSIRHTGGRIPLFGDGDSGRVLPSGFDRRPSHDPLIWLGTALLGRQAPLEGLPAAEVAWTLGLRAWEAAAEAVPAAGEPRAAFQQGGLYVLRGEGIHAVVRCGDLGQKGAGGHGHNDALSYELGYGVPFVVDSGTYAYTADPAARNLFRSTAAHNSVVVDGTEINPVVENDMFHLSQFAHPIVEEWAEGARMVRLVASHDGYRDLPGGVTHRRVFELDRTTGELSVVDELQGSGDHRAESFVHLAPDTRVTRNGSLEFDLVNGEARARIAFSGFDGSIEVAEGWVSSEFGRRERAALLVARWSGSVPTRFGYTLVGIRETMREEASREVVASR